MHGGPCEAGPLPDGTCCREVVPCVPVPSVRTARRQVTKWAVGLALGITALMLAGGAGNQLLMPGPLSASHGNLGDCETCHTGGDTMSFAWIHNVVDHVDPVKNSSLCIKCHELGADALSPHNRPAAALEQLTLKAREVAADISMPGIGGLKSNVLYSIPVFPADLDESQVQCATCHDEHNGVGDDLTIVSNARCQSCHEVKFDTFSGSHPQFTDYPFTRRTRIKFDHKSHIDRHFDKARETPAFAAAIPNVCSDCHEQGPDNKYMEIKSFDSMCSGCHLGDIQGDTIASGPKGIDFITVPGLDLIALEERRVDIGEWPEDSEAEITAFMRSLLAALADNQDLVNELADLDLLDLTDADEDDLASVQKLAWTVKTLFRKIELTGLPSVMKLLPNSDGSEVDRLQLSHMSAVMPRDVIASANREWFPNLASDLENHRNGRPTEYFQSTGAVSEPPDQSDLGTDTLDFDANGADLTDADLESGGGLLEDANLSTDGDLSEGLILHADDSDILADDSAGGLEMDLEDDSMSAGLLASDAGDNLEPGSGGLDGNFEADLTDGGLSSALLTENGEDDLELNANDDEGGLLIGNELDTGLSDGQDSSDGGSGESIFGIHDEPALTAEDWAILGGWYREDYSIRFRPIGHADRFMRNWLTYSGHSYGGADEELFTPVFEKLSPNDAIGRCTKCHSIDDEAAGKHPKWRAFSTNRVRNRFTTFSHDPHIGADVTDGCTVCHKMDETAGSFLKTYEGGDPSVFAPTFRQIDKAICSSCHMQEAAGEDCTLCHQYHTVDVAHPVPQTRLSSK